MIKKIAFFLASVGGVGYFPKGSGTLGSLVTLPMVWFAAQYRGLAGVWAIVLLAYIIGTLATREVLKYTKHDPSLVVIDEVAGQAMAFIFIPQYLGSWKAYVAAFILFRIFDIFKIGPVKWADEKVENETGVMLDDIFAGLLAAAILWVLTAYTVLGSYF